MPIKDISDRRRPPRGGKLRIGERVTYTREDGTTVEAPGKLDHFLFDPEDESLLPVFERLYGDAPKSLPVMFYSDVREEIFPHYLKNWKSGKLWCWGDGETAHRADFEAGQVATIPCAPDCPYRCLPGDEQIRLSKEEKKQRSCRPEGTLRVILYEMPTMAVFEIRASLTSIVRINTGLDMIQSVAGRLAHVPLILDVVPVHQAVGGKANTNYCLQLDIRTSLIDLIKSRNTAPAGLLNVPQDAGTETGESDEPEIHMTPQDTQENSQDTPRKTFCDLMAQALEKKLITQDVHNAARKWSETATAESLSKKAEKWRTTLALDTTPKPEAIRDPAAIALQVATDIQKELGDGRARDELIDLMAKHPALNGHVERLSKAFAEAQGEPLIEQRILFEASRIILAKP